MNNKVCSDYIILEDVTVASLMSKVLNLIAKGWAPIGGVSIAPPGGSTLVTQCHYLQAMIMPIIPNVHDSNLLSKAGRVYFKEPDDSKAESDPENDKIKEINKKVADRIELTGKEASLRMVSCLHFYNEINGNHCCWAEGDKTFPECYPLGLKVGAPWPTSKEECSKCMAWQSSKQRKNRVTD